VKDWTKVNSLYYFRTVDLGLFLKTGSAYIIKDACILFITVNIHDSLLMISTAVLVTKQSRKQAKP